MKIHVFAPGDDLVTIAASHHTDLFHLMAQNPFLDPLRLCVGQPLCLEEEETDSPACRMVSRDEAASLPEFAAAYDLEPQALYALNPMRCGSRRMQVPNKGIHCLVSEQEETLPCFLERKKCSIPLALLAELNPRVAAKPLLSTLEPGTALLIPEEYLYRDEETPEH